MRNIFKFFIIIQGLFLPLCTSGTQNTLKLTLKENAKTYDDEEKPERYLGYGYDAFGGPIYETTNALHLNYPILNLDALSNRITIINSSKTTYTNATSSSKSSISKSLGEESAGGATTAAQISAWAVKANVSLNASFNMAATENWQSVQNEEFSYHNIYVQNKTVVFQYDFDNEDSTAYLSKNFLNDAKKINSELQAKSFFQKYGTHLLTGYNLGGIFQMTNYYATNSSSYTKEQTTSFETQVSAGLEASKYASSSTSVDYSFSQKYGYKDNNSHATNQYKLTTFGGEAFPGLTIDQAFSYYEPAVGKGGYLYDIWTDSINEGTNTVIVSIPTYSPMIPLYKVLPNNGTYEKAKSYLLNQYLKETQEAIEDYSKNNKDAIYTDMKYESSTAPSVSIEGYDTFVGTKANSYYTSHAFDMDTTDYRISIKKGNYISLNYTPSNVDGLNCKWYLKYNSQAKYLEPYGYDSNGLKTTYSSFKVREDITPPSGTKITLYYGNGTISPLKQITLEFDDNDFYGGSGTEEDPYLIANAEQLQNIWKDKDPNLLEKHYKLISDIDMKGKNFVPIGDVDLGFSGSFDGNGYVIKNLAINDDSVNEVTALSADVASSPFKKGNYFLGLFSNIESSGVVKNLTIDSSSIEIKNDASDKFLGSVGFIAGVNEGDISNCYVKNSNIMIKFTDPKAHYTKNNAFIGGIFGVTQAGFITSCGVSNCIISIKNHKIGASCVGSVVGAILGQKCSIEHCYSKNNECTNEFVGNDALTSDNVRTYAGGFVGIVQHISKFTDCLIKNNKVNASSNDKNAFEVLASYLCPYFNMQSSADAKQNKLLSNVLVYEMGSECEILSKINGVESNSDIGSLYANFDYSGDDELDSFFDNVYVYAKTEVPLFGQGRTFDGTNIKTTTTITGFSKESWTGSSYATKELKEHTINDVSFNFENVKTEFVIGDSFYVGEILGTKEYSDGSDPENFDDVSVDYSEFNSNVAGVYTIKVSAYGFTDQYTVTVREPTVSSISVKNEEKVYFAGDKFDTSTLTVKAFMENGTTKSIAVSDCVIDMSKQLSEGQNKITISYGGASTYLIVNAIAKNIEKVELTSLPSKSEYNVDDKTLDLSGLEITVTYDNSNAPKDIVKYDDNKDDFQTYYSALKEGLNTIRLSYVDCSPISFDVKAVDDPIVIDQEMLSNFTNAVNLLDTATSLEKYRAILIEAREQKEALLKAYSEDALNKDSIYCVANEKYENGLLNYQNYAKKINDDFDSALGASHALFMKSLDVGLGSIMMSLDIIIALIVLL